MDGKARTVSGPSLEEKILAASEMYAAARNWLQISTKKTYFRNKIYDILL